MAVEAWLRHGREGAAESARNGPGPPGPPFLRLARQTPVGSELGTLCPLLGRRLVADSEGSSLIISWVINLATRSTKQTRLFAGIYSFIHLFVHSFIHFCSTPWVHSHLPAPAEATPAESCSPHLVSGALGPTSYPSDLLLASSLPCQHCASVAQGISALGFSVISTRTDTSLGNTRPSRCGRT